MPTECGHESPGHVARGASRQPGQARSSQRDRRREQVRATTDDQLRSVDRAEEDCPPLVARRSTGRDERQRPRVPSLLCGRAPIRTGTLRATSTSFVLFVLRRRVGPTGCSDRTVTSSRGLPIVAASQEGENRSTGAQNQKPGGADTCSGKRNRPPGRCSSAPGSTTP